LRFTVDTVVDREPRAAIWEVRVDSTGLRRLPLGTTTSNECCGTWTPDGHFFVFQSRQPGRTDVWVIAEPRGVLQDPAPEPKQLTSGPLHFLAPGVSADGTRLFAVGRSDRGELVRFDAALRTFVPYLNGMSAVWIDFSRDEESVIYVRYPEDTLWRARADGSDARQLTFPPMQVDGCSWSPDGKRIAFRARTPGHASRVFIMSAEGGDAKPLIEEDREQGVPTWSRDGRHLAFGEVPAVYGQPGREAIQLYDLERRAFSKLPESTNLWSPRWSPDGRYIAAVALPGFRLRLFDVAKGSWRSFEADHVDHATWSKDSKYINYHTEGSVRSLRRVRISDGFVEEIASLDGYPIKAYWWSGLALDGSPLVVRDLVPPEIYALELERR
jgi:Tol biopolymer transport system component